MSKIRLRSSLFRHVSLATIVAIYAIPSISSAQSSAEDDEDSNAIVVTATRTAKSVMDVPVSIAALTQDQMDERGIRQFSDLVRFTPGLTFNNVSPTGRNNIAIRGISSNAGAATTGIYIDDIPIQVRQVGYASGTSLPVIFDLERVEVLRGPQGTLFGSGSEGGTVRFIQAKPSVTEFSGYARAEGAVTEHAAGSYEFGAAVGGPIVEDKIGFRTSAYFRRDGGWYDKVTADLSIVDPTGVSVGDSVDFDNTSITDKNVNWAETYALRGALLLQPTEGFSITPSIFYQKRKVGSGQSTYWLSGSDAPKSFTYVDFSPGTASEATGLTAMTLPDSEAGYSDMLVAGLNAEWHLDGASVYLTSSYLEQNKHQYYDYTTGYEISYMGQEFARDGAKGASLYKDAQKVWTHEFRIQSDTPDAFINWVAGAFYSKSRQHSHQYIEVNTMYYSQNFFGIGNLDDAAPFGPGYNTFQNIWGADPINDSGVYLADAYTREQQVAAFGQVDIHPLDKVTVTVGARWSHNKLKYSLFSSGAENNLNAPYGAACPTGGYCTYGSGVFAPEYPNGSVSGSENAFTPKVSVSYKPNDNNMVYASAAKGYRPGGGQIPLPTACDSGLVELGYVDSNGEPTIPLIFGSDSVWSYEVGSKNRLFGGKVNVSGSAYMIKWDNIQSSISVPVCGYAFTDNLESATVKGFDLSVEVSPVKGLHLMANVGYQHTKFDNSSSVIASSGPPWTVVLSADYRKPISETTNLYGRVDYSYLDVNAGLSSSALIMDALEASEQVNARVGADIGNIDLSLFVNNLFNAHPLTYATRSRYIWQGMTLRPRTMGVTASLRF